MKTQVLVVGGGPVGLTLAVDLGKRGVACTLIEQKEEPAFLPKMERCNTRTMEIYRRMGIVDKVRNAGLASHIPMDVYVVFNLAEPPLVHAPYPSVDEARANIKARNDGALGLEPYQLISQYTLEPLLKEVACSLPSVTVRYGCELLSFTQDEAGVTATIRKSDGSTEKIEAAYLAGCDGGASQVRRQLDIKLRGDADITRFNQALFRCDDLFDRIPIGDGPGPGRHYHVADEYGTFIIMQDSTKHFTLHAAVESEDEMKHLFEQTITLPLDYELLYCGEWRHNLLLADRYRDGRVFLAGDAVHLVIPTGGLGMNSGVGDAVDLSWKLAATIEGWGGPELLNAYEIERRQVGEKNVAASRFASTGRRAWRREYVPEIRNDAVKRDKFIQLVKEEQPKSNEMIGAELGYRYEGSPIICDQPGGPEYDFRTYRPSSWPGARLPHVWLDDGSAIQDKIPDGYVLLRLGETEMECAGLARSFEKLGAPFSVLDIPDNAAREVYGYDALLLRPDLHIAWRGNGGVDTPDQLAQVVSGYRHC